MLGGQGKGKPKLGDRQFGSALIKSQNPKNKFIPKNKQILSILDNSSLDDYIASAEMDDKDTEVIKTHSNDVQLVEVRANVTVQDMYQGQMVHQHLSIPRKPQWSKDMTTEELDRLETDAFLNWRRHLAHTEASNPGYKLTPFEKNLDVWRQLWRAVEQCEILIQIVDARNPLFYL